MFNFTTQPRFCDTDALGHVNNVAVASMMEACRIDFFKLFIPDLDPNKWNLIIARCEIDYIAQCYYQYEVVIESYFEKIGNSSMVLVHDVFQNEKQVAKGKFFIIHFDYGLQKSVTIPDDIRKELDQHLKI